MRRFCLLLAFLLLVPLGIFAQQAPPPLPAVFPAGVSGDVITSGSATAAILTNQVVSQFRNEGYQGNIVVDAGGTTAAIDRFCNGELDVVNADRRMTNEERNACTLRERTVIEFRVASDAIVFVTSLQNTFLTDVTANELQQIMGTALSWSQVRPEWPDQPINRYIPVEDTSEYEFISNLIFAGDTSSMRRALGAQTRPTSSDLLAAVQNDPFGITFVNSPLAQQNLGIVKQLGVNGIGANADSAASGAYTLARPILLYSAREVLQQQQVADFLNFYLTNINIAIQATGFYPAPPDELAQGRLVWLNNAPQEAAPVAPTVAPPPPVEGGEQPPAEEEVNPPVVEEATGPTIEQETLDLLVGARSDLETLATSRFALERPEGWNGSLDAEDPQLALLIRLDLELLAGLTLGESVRPDAWFGAIPSSNYALARDIRHDLELLATQLYNTAERPDNWVSAPRILQCNRATQTLVQMLARGGVFTLNVPEDDPNYCHLAELAATRFSEVNLLGAPSDQAIFSSAARATLPGSQTIDTEFAVAFLDRGAALNVGVVPFGEPVRPVARSFAQFSKMMLIEGQDFLVYVDHRDTTVNDEQFDTLPDAAQSEVQTFCGARWCGN